MGKHSLCHIRQLFLLFFILICGSALTAQETITGKIITAEGNQPLRGATVTIKNSGNSVVTDINGLYKVAASGDEVLVISNIGFVTREIKANEAALIMMSAEQKNLDEVIVTALGIRREEKSLGYAAQTVKENAVKDAKTNNWVTVLSGKVAGLNIQGTGAGPMGSSRITLAGRVIIEPRE